MRNVIKKTIPSLLLTLALMISLAPASFASEPKLLALTFDDGPSAAYTPTLLDGLDARNVKVTFFVVGNVLTDSSGSINQQSANIITRAAESGHQIASHSYSHPFLTKLGDSQILSQVNSTENALNRILGTETEYMFRLPYGDGAGSSRVKSLINRPIILWSVDPTNGRYPASEEKLYSGIINNAKDGAIILLHDAHGTANVNAALRAIDTLRAQGYEFVTLNELFRLKGANPVSGTAYYSIGNAISVFYDESQLSSHWAWSDISYVRDNSIMLGDGEGFKPNAHLTRSMAITILWRTLGEPEAENTDLNFPDAAADEWYSGAVAWAVENNIMLGYNNGYFGTNDEMTREQFYTVLARIASLEGSFSAVYTDDDRISGWARDSVGAIRTAGFSSKNDIELFRPKTEITRAETAELIHWFLDNAAF